MVAPYTTRSSLAHSAVLMHIGQGSHVVYSVYPASESCFSRFVASRIARTSAWALGSNSPATLFSARSSNSPVFVCTTEAPNGRGRAVFKDRAVNAASAAIRSTSPFVFVSPRAFSVAWRAAVEATPILELSMLHRPRAPKNGPL